MLGEMPPDHDGLDLESDPEPGSSHTALLGVTRRLDSLESRQKEAEATAAASAAAEAARAAAIAQREKEDARVEKACQGFLSWLEPDESKASDIKALWDAKLRGEPPPKH